MPDKLLDHVVSSKQAGLAFFDQAMILLEKLRRTQADVIQKAAELCAERISLGGLVFLFGNGHSRMM
ncbi:MAG: SIS domain-containing protein, partial [Candidatus Sulfotelmatobacter sp.]